MMAKIITKSNSDEIAGWITEFLSSAPSTLVRLEGVCGSGKTTIGRKLSERGVGLHINADKFATKPSKPTPYPQMLEAGRVEWCHNPCHSHGQNRHLRCGLIGRRCTGCIMGTRL